MLLIMIIKTLLLHYDNGTVWCSIDDIITFFLLIVLSIIILPFTILGDILFMPIEIIIFMIRKHNHKALWNKKYTLKDFINEID